MGIGLQYRGKHLQGCLSLQTWRFLNKLGSAVFGWMNVRLMVHFICLGLALFHASSSHFMVDFFSSKQKKKNFISQAGLISSSEWRWHHAASCYENCHSVTGLLAESDPPLISLHSFFTPWWTCSVLQTWGPSCVRSTPPCVRSTAACRCHVAACVSTREETVTS